MLKHSTKELWVETLICGAAAAQILHDQFFVGQRDKLDKLLIILVTKLFCNHEEAIGV